MFQLTVFQFWILVCLAVVGCSHLMLTAARRISKQRKRANKTNAVIKKMTNDISWLTRGQQSVNSSLIHINEDIKRVQEHLEQLDDILAGLCDADHEEEEPVNG